MTSEKEIGTISKNTKSEPDLFQTIVFLAHMLPKNLVSFLTGYLVRIEFPEPLARFLNKCFVKIFGINMAEAELPIEDFKSIEEVFTRKLKADARSIDSDFCSPADGFLAYSQALQSNQAIQAKGLSYCVSDLIFGETAEQRTGKYSWFTTVYLAPHNYHRVHTPLGGRLLNVRYIPGELWPVNNPFVKRLPRLFVRNERLCFDIEVAKDAYAHVVMVGALNVGRIASGFLGQEVTNSWERQFGTSPRNFPQNTCPTLKAGDELGTFMLGSTVVVVLDENAEKLFKLKSQEGDFPIELGRTLLAND